MNKNKVKLAIIGTGQRATTFAQSIYNCENAELTALCDINETRLNYFAKNNDYFDSAKMTAHARLFTSTDELLSADICDGVIITVPDKHHCEIAKKVFAAGKHCMLEKPMALTINDCKAIIKAKEESGCMLQVGFVLRSTPFYQKIKSIIDSGILGQIMNISASEFLSVGHSISYMRRWHRKKENSGSFLLAKCSHDMDILSWLIGSRVKRVASFGDNNFFLPGKCPATHCSICPEADTCIYCFGRQGDGLVVLNKEEKANLSKYDIDICVYNNDKDIIDNQVAILEYENSVRAQFSLQCFYPYSSERMITINGSEAFLHGEFQTNSIEVIKSNTKEKISIDLTDVIPENVGHGGGDQAFLDEFVNSISKGNPPVADLYAGLASTVIANSIDKALMTKQVVEIDSILYNV
jgi:predicted dehydrogenase